MTTVDRMIVCRAAAEGITLELQPLSGKKTSTGYKGVSFQPKTCHARPYRASYRVSTYEKKFVGLFATAEQAALEIARVALKMKDE